MFPVVRLSAKRFCSLLKNFLVTIIQIDNGSAHKRRKTPLLGMLSCEMSPFCTDATTLCFLVAQFFYLFFFFSLKSQLTIVAAVM